MCQNNEFDITKIKYIHDKETMNSLDIETVMLQTGLWELKGSKIVHMEHKKKNKPKSKIKNNCCSCHDCGFSGDVVAVAEHYKGNFNEGLKWLSDTFNVFKKPNPKYIPPKNEKQLWSITKKNFSASKPKVPIVNTQKVDSNKELSIFEPNKKRKANVRKGMEMYDNLSLKDKMMVVYTCIYNYSLQQQQDEKLNYFESRQLNMKHSKIKEVGFIPVEKFDELTKKLVDKFNIEDLIELKVLNDKEHKQAPLKFKLWYVKKGGLIVYPSFHIYQTNLVTAFMFRPTHPEKWMIDSSMKEIQMSNNYLFSKTPYGLTYDTVANNNAIKCIVEGGPDSMCCPETINGKNLLFIASEGTHGFKQEHFGYFKGQKLRIMLDPDVAGKKGTYGYILVQSDFYKDNKGKEFTRDKKGYEQLHLERERLNANKAKFFETKHDGYIQKCLNADVIPEVCTWDEKYGDLNDVRKSILNGTTPFKSMNEFLTNFITVTRVNKID